MPGPDEFRPEPRLRRREDYKTYRAEHITLHTALVTWGSAFFYDISVLEGWSQALTPKFIGVHAAQMIGLIAAVWAAVRIKTKSRS